MPVLGDELNGLSHGLVHLDRHQVGPRDHNFPDRHVPHLEDSVDHLAFFFFEDALFLADGHEHLQFFFGHERALHLGTARQTQQQLGYAGQDPDDRPHDEGRPGHDPGKAQRHSLGALQCDRLGRDLAKDQDNQREQQADQPLGQLFLIKMQCQ